MKRTQEIKSRGPIARFFTSNADAKRLEGLIGEIRTSLDDFLVSFREGILSRSS